jgi:hypothetical protein
MEKGVRFILESYQVHIVDAQDIFYVPSGAIWQPGVQNISLLDSKTVDQAFQYQDND